MPILAHLDLDAFFAAVEELENPSLRRRPLVVGGDPRGRGVVATANYVARRFGIHSAMSAAEALRRCPDAVFLRPRHALYRQYSQAVWSAIREVVPRVERTGLDEGYRAELHKGATSQDVIDTALMLQLAKVFDVYEARLSGLLDALGGLTAEHAAKPLMAHTRMQVALPTTWGAKFLSWSEPLERHLRSLRAMRRSLLVVQLGGPVGDRGSFDGFGDAIAGGFVYRGKRIPALQGKLVFGDITTGHIWYAEMQDVLGADDGNPMTLAPMHQLETGLRALVEQTFRARGGRGDSLPGAAAVSGRGRVDLRFAEDAAGELYVLTKSDGMIRQVVGLR